MSQYLNIYIKAKEHDKTLFLTQYSRNSEVYDIITEEYVIPYDGDGKTFCDLPLSTLQSCHNKTEYVEQRETERSSRQMDGES